MKSITRKRTGLCFVCGKPTHLLIHGRCSRGLVTDKAEALRLRKARKTQKQYAAGRSVPGANQ